MSLLPLVFSDWWEDLDRPHSVFDQDFGLHVTPSDLLPLSSDVWAVRPYRKRLYRYRPYDRSLAKRSATSGVSTVQPNKDKFELTLDVQQFAPEEVIVKVVDKNVIVEGKHEEKQDEHGWISRQFVRRYLIPEQCDIDQLQSTLSSDGVLSIIVPRKESEPQEKKERIIKIQNTGQPALKDDDAISKAKNLQKEQSSQTQKSPVTQRGAEKTVKAA
ncbi:protein lethal(2)essential for life [Cephus cinctus]|uniref:Protein lethal(2)essential for life n=1 Tax=Cephus cinctus TaxID=211228 RepID=A0AAJ7W7N0_CEPCN|nr:protein lethal(2)essential for life [Cephus cinctus]XP_024947647.1 protein lethal(2)essential for life [Cephus cinctus]